MIANIVPALIAFAVLAYIILRFLGFADVCNADVVVVAAVTRTPKEVGALVLGRIIASRLKSGELIDAGLGFHGGKIG